MELQIKTETGNPYRLALASAKIMDLKKSESTKELIDLLSKTYYEAGQVVPGYDTREQGKNLQILSDNLHIEVKQYFSFLKMDEIKLAFANGVRKEYGEFFGLNIATFHSWLKAYQFDTKRKEALQKLKEEQALPVAPLLSVTEAEYEWKQAMQRQFENYKATGVLKIEFPGYQFKEFEKRGLINLSATDKQFIWEQAKERISELKKLRRLNPKDIKEREKCTKALNEISTGQLSDETKVEVKSQAQKISIELFYNSIEKLTL